MEVVRACRVSLPARPDVLLTHRFDVLPATCLFPFWRRLLFARWLVTTGRLSDFGLIEGWVTVGTSESTAGAGAS